MIEKKVGRYISLRMGIAMSITMSIVGALLGALTAVKQSGAPFIMAFLPAFLVSLVITMILAIGIGFIVPMKKVNDGIAKTTKTKGFVLHLLQSLVSDLIYTPFIGLVMAFVSTALFVVPRNPGMPLVPVALGTFAKGLLPEFIIALIVIMILEPIFQKAAFKKYIPNYGRGVEGDEDI